MAKLAQGLDLNITGFRIGPRDPNNPSVAAVGQDNFFYQKPPEVAILPKVLKGRDVLGGGYKFPKESLKARAELAGKLNDNLLNDSEHLDDTILLQDQIINDLNLIPGAHPGADNKSGSLTKAALTKDLTENITKEIEKLRRQGDNIITRKQLFVEGKIDEETPEERNYNIKSGLEDKGCTVIYTEDERVQAMRHQTGQLGGLGAITMEEVVAMRELTAQRIKELEIEYKLCIYHIKIKLHLILINVRHSVCLMYNKTIFLHSQSLVIITCNFEKLLGKSFISISPRTLCC